MFCGLDTPSVQTWPVGPGVNLTPVVYLSTVLLSKAFYSLFLTVAYFSQSHIFSRLYLKLSTQHLSGTWRFAKKIQWYLKLFTSLKA